LIPGDYYAEFIVSPEQGVKLKPGLTAFAVRPNFSWRVEMLTKRPVPIAFRDDRRVTEETVVRAHFTLPEGAGPGASAEFELP